MFGNSEIWQIFGPFWDGFGLNELYVINMYVRSSLFGLVGFVEFRNSFLGSNTYYKISIFQNTFIKRGGNLRDNCPVKQIFPMDETMVKIELLDGSVVKTKSLVICAGPWTNKLMNPLG